MHHTHTSKYNCYTFQRQLLFLDTCEVLYNANTEFVKQYDLVCRKCEMIIKKKIFCWLKGLLSFEQMTGQKCINRAPKNIYFMNKKLFLSIPMSKIIVLAFFDLIWQWSREESQGEKEERGHKPRPLLEGFLLPSELPGHPWICCCNKKGELLFIYKGNDK